MSQLELFIMKFPKLTLALLSLSCPDASSFTVGNAGRWNVKNAATAGLAVGNKSKFISKLGATSPDGEMKEIPDEPTSTAVKPMAESESVPVAAEEENATSTKPKF